MILMKQKNIKNDTIKWYVTFDGVIKEISLEDMCYLYSMVQVDYRTPPVTIGNSICVNIFCHPLEWCIDSIRTFGKNLLGVSDV